MMWRKEVAWPIHVSSLGEIGHIVASLYNRYLGT